MQFAFLGEEQMRCIENNIDAAMADAETAGEESEAEERQLHYDMSQQWRSLWRAGNPLKLLPRLASQDSIFCTNNLGVPSGYFPP